jgi:hypothetical protein
MMGSGGEGERILGGGGWWKQVEMGVMWEVGGVRMGVGEG